MLFLTTNISDTIHWEIVGKANVTGKDLFLKKILDHKLWKVKELVIDTIITHGTDASVSGQITTSDNSTFSFCDVYKLKGASGTTINSMKTFLIQ
jgi:hypothetical protein